MNQNYTKYRMIKTTPFLLTPDEWQEKGRGLIRLCQICIKNLHILCLLFTCVCCDTSCIYNEIYEYVFLKKHLNVFLYMN